jgi:hypothetical protein
MNGRPMVDDSFKEFVLDQLNSLTYARKDDVRRMDFMKAFELVSDGGRPTLYFGNGNFFFLF